MCRGRGGSPGRDVHTLISGGCSWGTIRKRGLWDAMKDSRMLSCRVIGEALKATRGVLAREQREMLRLRHTERRSHVEREAETGRSTLPWGLRRGTALLTPAFQTWGSKLREEVVLKAAQSAVPAPAPRALLSQAPCSGSRMLRVLHVPSRVCPGSRAVSPHPWAEVAPGKSKAKAAWSGRAPWSCPCQWEHGEDRPTDMGHLTGAGPKVLLSGAGPGAAAVGAQAAEWQLRGCHGAASCAGRCYSARTEGIPVQRGSGGRARLWAPR